MTIHFLPFNIQLLKMTTTIAFFMLIFTIPSMAQKKKPRAEGDALCFSSPVPATAKVIVPESPSKTLRNLPIKSTRFASDQSLPVKSVSDGKVVSVFDIEGSNNVVLVRTGSHYIYYSNITNLTVKKGDRVSTAQVIGSVDKGDETYELDFGIYFGKMELESSQYLALNAKK